MPGLLLPHHAGYEISGPGGGVAGHEELQVDHGGAGWLIRSRIETTWPEEISASVSWELDRSMATRRLYVHSEERFSGAYELELTITGNGLLAHRDAPDGPTQVELGWGPDAELDYLSAAFPAVMLARSNLDPGASRGIDAVQLATVDLVPTILAMRLRGLPVGTLPGGGTPPPAQVEASRVECLVVDTGHVATISVAASGALLAYSGLLRMAWLEPTK